MNQPAINVTPLIDVLLVLLIIFMVITPIKPSSFDTRIPKEPESDRPIDAHPDTLVVSYGSNGRIGINHEPEMATIEDISQITTCLREVFELRKANLNPERTVFIKAPKGLDYGSVAKMIDAVKLGGADPISLQIDGID